MPKKPTRRKATKPKPRKKAVKLAVFPSRFKIGQEVKLNFFLSGEVKNGNISGVTFTESKVYYDVDIMIRQASRNETENIISERKALYVTLKEVDSVCVESI